MTKDQIRAIFLGAGFTIKEGQTDLKPYVYEAAEALLSASIADTAGAKPVAWRHNRTFCLYETEEEVPLADGDEWAEPLYLAAPPAPSVADAAGASDKPLTDAQIEAGWRQTFSTENPYCPCNLKTFTKAVRWAERAKESK